MGKNERKYVGLATLQTFLDNLKNLFATKTSVDELSADVDGKANASHSHAISDITDLQTTLDTINDSINTKLDTETATSTYETKTDAQLKYDEIIEAKADWNQNDETAVDYIKNKPVYIETELETMDTFTFTSGRGNNKISCAINFIDDKTAELELGKKYTVVFDGTTYSDLVCYDSGFSSCMLGEYVNLGGDSPDFLEYPFSITEYGDQYRIFTEGNSGSHNVEILKQIEKVYFYEEFIPDSIARVSYVDELKSIKQDKLTGEEGYFVQFDSSGNPIAVIPEFITVDDIDTICGGQIQSASDVMF